MVFRNPVIAVLVLSSIVVMGLLIYMAWSLVDTGGDFAVALSNVIRLILIAVLSLQLVSILDCVQSLVRDKRTSGTWVRVILESTISALLLAWFVIPWRSLVPVVVVGALVFVAICNALIVLTAIRRLRTTE